MVATVPAVAVFWRIEARPDSRLSAAFHLGPR
jgi:hypothetical protein